MRAITYATTGDPDVLELVDKPVQDPGPGQVRVRIHRSGVNPTDWKSRRGSAPGTALPAAQVPNQDGSGVVDAVGQGVGRHCWAPGVVVGGSAPRAGGDRAGLRAGASHQAVLLPDNASFDLGASLGVPFMTAHRCLTVTEGGPSRLGPGTLQGRTVLVSGGAGAVGNAAIQLARWSDATVITTVSTPEKGNLAARAGADHVIDYKQEDVVTRVRAIAPDGVDTIVEVAAAANADIDVQVLGLHGSVAIYADDGTAPLTVPVRPLMMPNVRLQFVLVYTAPHDWKVRALEDISAAVLDGAVRVGEEAGLPLHHYPLEQTAAAHAAVEDGATGKVLIDVGD